MKIYLLTALLVLSTGAMAQTQAEENAQLKALQNEKSKAALQTKIRTLENGSAGDLNTLIQYYVKDSVKRVQVSRRLVRKYPESQEAMMVRLRPFMKLSKVEEAERLLQSMKKDYPGINLDMEKTLVACMYAEIPDTTSIMKHINTIEAPATRVAAITQALDIIAAFDNATALNMASGRLKAVQATKDLPAAGTGMRTDPKAVYYSFIKTYSKLLFKAGRNEEAYPFTMEAYEHSGERDAELVENYGFLSSLNGKYEAALPILSNSVKEGKFEKRYVDQVRKAYASLYPEKDAEAYISTLQQTFRDKVKAHVSTLLVDEPAPGFSISDVNGKKVSLADFEGKTIVLDFWATWCGPCVESFPAMQMAVDRYANDPDVKFLFIHCWENAPDPLSDAKNFLSKRDYKFDLYMDPRDPVTRRSAAADAFKIDGIPAKFIIDGRGRIRFSVAGFEGKAEAAAEEVIQMVEMARNQ
ncbi:TlpA family protein disulfide reductase [Pedobacter deserti]|uniref:TlpA family protein disulfide reductase n=1 Tax=Pedobacter deserti TaxID=2817382 RepID=UPI00210AD5E2|nr:TlpA disulfide reductase family protein [Pedobacter sp. SYSU D00382]